MKLDKSKQKELKNQIRVSAKNRKYKVRGQSIYTTRKDAFIHCVYAFINSQKLIYNVSVKNYDYDNIFWNIMQMSENIKMSDSLRAIGAFVAPSILIKQGEIEFSDKLYVLAEDFVNQIDNASNDFLCKYDVDDYIINNKDHIENEMDKEILKYLAYVHMGKNKEAVEIAEDSLRRGIKGRFQNEGKWFFEWVMSK